MKRERNGSRFDGSSGDAMPGSVAAEPSREIVGEKEASVWIQLREREPTSA